MAIAGYFRNGVQTSKYVIKLEEFLKDFFFEVLHNYNLPDIKKCNVDIFIPELNTVIEYDSFYYHGQKQGKDIEKSKKILDKGYNLLRILSDKKPPKPEVVLDQVSSFVGYHEIHTE